MDHAIYDKRRYPIVGVREGYAEWSRTYESTVHDEMDLRLLERVRTIDWPSARAGRVGDDSQLRPSLERSREGRGRRRLHAPRDGRRPRRRGVAAKEAAVAGVRRAAGQLRDGVAGPAVRVMTFRLARMDFLMR